MKATTSEHITSQQAMSKLGISRMTLHRKVKAGELSTIKKKGKIYFPIAQFQHKDQVELFTKETKQAVSNTGAEGRAEASEVVSTQQIQLDRITDILKEKDKQLSKLEKKNEKLNEGLMKLNDKLIKLIENDQVLRKVDQDIRAGLMLGTGENEGVYTEVNTKTKKKTKKKKKTGFMGFFTRML